MSLKKTILKANFLFSLGLWNHRTLFTLFMGGRQSTKGLPCSVLNDVYRDLRPTHHSALQKKFLKRLFSFMCDDMFTVFNTGISSFTGLLKQSNRHRKSC